MRWHIDRFPVQVLKRVTVLVLICYFFAGCKREQPKAVLLVVEKVADSSLLRPRDSMGEVVFNGLIWLFGGFTPDRSNEVWFSANGYHWTKAPAPVWPKRNLPGAIVFKNKVWILGGYGGDSTRLLNDVYSSSDGLNWNLVTSSAPWTPRAAFGLAVLGDSLYLFGGITGFDGMHTNDVWATSDGISWTQLTATAAWAPRGMMGSCTFNNRVWMIGGGEYDDKYVYNVRRNYNDIWSTSDGVNWKNETQRAAFSPRRFFSSVVYREKIYVMTGFELDQRIFPNNSEGLEKSKLSAAQLGFYDTHKGRYFGNLNDIWESSDGRSWKKTMTTDTFPIRHEPSVVMHRDAIYLVGGFGAELYNDVWRLY